MRRVGAVALVLLASSLILAACSGGLSPEPTPSPPGKPAPMVPDLNGVPPLDLTMSIVDPRDVVYDTLDGSFRALPEAGARLVRSLRDAISPIYVPEYVDARSASDWLAEGDRVIGVEGAGVAYAYPTNTLAFLEIVKETFDGVPALVTYCPLCASGVVFDRRVDGQTLLFGNTSARYDHDLVMYDHQTGSYWHQTSGTAIVGTLSGKRMEPLPSLITTFGEWRELYPQTRVLSNDAARARASRDSRRQIQDTGSQGRFFFPVRDEVKEDRRLDLGAETLQIRLAGQTKAYALDDLKRGPVNDRVAGIPVVVLRSAGEAMAAYVARVDGRDLTFDAGDGDTVVDRETGSVWNVGGHATEGVLAGTRLTLVPGVRALWFSIAGATQDVPLFSHAAP